MSIWTMDCRCPGADLGIFVRESNLFWQKGVVNAGRGRGAVLLFRNPRDTIVHGIQFRNGQAFEVI